MKSNQTIKNRGALSNPDGRFEPQTRENLEDGWNIEEEILPPWKLHYSQSTLSQ